MKYAHEPLQRLLEDLSARTAVPGGGSGCAASAAVGAALGVMVANFSLGKGASAEVEARVKELLAHLTCARESFASLVDEDASAYDGVRAARKAKAPAQEVQHALVRAMTVPLGGVRACHRALQHIQSLCPHSNPRLVTDLACGALLLEAALAGMAFNVRVNLAEIGDTAIVRAAKEELYGLSKSAELIRKAVLAHVEKHLPR